MLRSNNIVPSIVPPPSRRPTRLLHVPLPIAPPALPIAARAALRVSYSQRTAMRVWCSQHALRVSYLQCHLLRVWCSQREGTLARWRWESIILSAGGTESMILSACAESIILSAPPTESMMLSAWGHSWPLSRRARSRAGCAERVSYSQLAALRVWCSQHVFLVVIRDVAVLSVLIVVVVLALSKGLVIAIMLP